MGSFGSIAFLLLSALWLSLFVFSHANNVNDLRGVDIRNPVLDVTPSPLFGLSSSRGSKAVLSCERVQVSGISRLELGSFASSLRVTLLPSVVIPERLHSKIQVCFHRNDSIGFCECEKDEWRSLQKGLWSSIMSPYDTKYVDVKFIGDLSGPVTLTVEEALAPSLFSIGVHFTLFAPVVSGWVPFYYSSSMAVGVLLVIIIVLFQGMKLLPTGRKSVFYLTIYGSLLGAGSFLLHHFSVLVNAILVNFGLSEEMHNPVSIFLLVAIFLVGAALGYWIVRKFVISKDGSVDAGVAQFVKWAMRIIGTTFILQSTLDTPLAIGALVSCWVLCKLITSLKSYWTIFFPETKCCMASQTSASEVTSRSELISSVPSILDSSSHLITNHKLHGQNFLKWSQSVFMYICGRGKDGHLTGEMVVPEATDPKYRSWKTDYHLVMSWLINSMTTNVGENFLLHRTEKEIWEAAREMYLNIENTFELFEVEMRLYDLKQGDMSVIQYFNTLTRCWLQLDLYENHSWKCANDCALYKRIIEQKRTIKFLLGLNKDLDEVRGRVMGIKPFPTIKEVFAEVRREESRKKLMMMDNTPTVEGSTLYTQNSSQSNRSSKGRPWCDYCKKLGHAKAMCWKLHGKPVDWKPSNAQYDRENCANAAVTIESSAKGNPFIREQIEAL